MPILLMIFPLKYEFCCNYIPGNQIVTEFCHAVMSYAKFCSDLINCKDFIDNCVCENSLVWCNQEKSGYLWEASLAMPSGEPFGSSGLIPKDKLCGIHQEPWQHHIDPHNFRKIWKTSGKFGRFFSFITVLQLVLQYSSRWGCLFFFQFTMVAPSRCISFQNKDNIFCFIVLHFGSWYHFKKMVLLT